MWVKGIGCFSILLLDRESSPFVLTETCVPRARVPYIYTRACEWGSVSSSFAAGNHARRRCSCRESNPDLIFRRDLFYPLNYKSIKKGIPLYPNLVNLKSNTMKNTMQRYRDFWLTARGMAKKCNISANRPFFWKLLLARQVIPLARQVIPPRLPDWQPGVSELLRRTP